MLDTTVAAGLRVGFAVGERLAPGRAAKLAQYLWLRVPKAPPLAQRYRGVEPGEPLDVYIGERKLAAYSWGSGPVVLMMHGWGAWWQHFSVYVEPFVAAGYRVVAWDAPGHGDSPEGRLGPRQASIPDFADSIKAIVAALDGEEPVAVLSHSGGAMAAALSVLHGVSATSMVMIAPSVDARNVLDYVQRRLGLGPVTLNTMVDNMERRFDISFERDFNVVRAAERHEGELPPLLLVHDPGDPDAPYSGSETLVRVWPKAELMTTNGLGHRRVLWHDDTVQAALDFVGAHR